MGDRALLGDPLGAHIRVRDPLDMRPTGTGAVTMPPVGSGLVPVGSPAIGGRRSGHGGPRPAMEPPQSDQHRGQMALSAPQSRYPGPMPDALPDLAPRALPVPGFADDGAYRAETVRPGPFVAPADSTHRAPMSATPLAPTVFAQGAVAIQDGVAPTLAWAMGPPQSSRALQRFDTGRDGAPAILEPMSLPVDSKARAAGVVDDPPWSEPGEEWRTTATEKEAFGDPVADRDLPGSGSRPMQGSMSPPLVPGVAAGSRVLAPPAAPGPPESVDPEVAGAPAGPMSLGGGLAASNTLHPGVGDRSSLPGGKTTPGFQQLADAMVRWDEAWVLLEDAQERLDEVVTKGPGSDSFEAYELESTIAELGQEIRDAEDDKATAGATSETWSHAEAVAKRLDAQIRARARTLRERAIEIQIRRGRRQLAALRQSANNASNLVAKARNLSSGRSKLPWQQDVAHAVQLAAAAKEVLAVARGIEAAAVPGGPDAAAAGKFVHRILDALAEAREGVQVARERQHRNYREHAGRVREARKYLRIAKEKRKAAERALKRLAVARRFGAPDSVVEDLARKHEQAAKDAAAAQRTAVERVLDILFPPEPLPRGGQVGPPGVKPREPFFVHGAFGSCAPERRDGDKGECGAGGCPTCPPDHSCECWWTRIPGPDVKGRAEALLGGGAVATDDSRAGLQAGAVSMTDLLWPGQGVGQQAMLLPLDPTAPGDDDDDLTIHDLIQKLATEVASNPEVLRRAAALFAQIAEFVGGAMQRLARLTVRIKETSDRWAKEAVRMGVFGQTPQTMLRIYELPGVATSLDSLIGEVGEAVNRLLGAAVKALSAVINQAILDLMRPGGRYYRLAKSLGIDLGAIATTHLDAAAATGVIDPALAAKIHDFAGQWQGLQVELERQILADLKAAWEGLLRGKDPIEIGDPARKRGHTWARRGLVVLIALVLTKRFAGRTRGKGPGKGSRGTPVPNYPKVPKKWPKRFKTHQEFGEQGMGWGKGQDKGVEVTREATSRMTKEGLQEMGLTREMAVEWNRFYTGAVAAGKGGLQGVARRDMFRKAVDLLGR
jgi:hypothetical protein